MASSFKPYDEEGRVYDELLVTLVRTGDRAAAERLAARWHPRLMRTARRWLRDGPQAEEAVQEAWAGIVKGWWRLSDPAKFPAWAFGILYRKCADRISANVKDRTRMVTLEDEASESSQPRAENLLAVDQALERLSPDHRLAAILFFGEGLTLKEIAKVAGVPVGTAKSRIYHARQQLRSLLGENNDE
ncbi:MAG: sigma-70 family RNA polymerase sigma factor [Pseudomonadota bacterium]